MTAHAPGSLGGVGFLAAYLKRVGIGGRGRRSSLTRWLRIHQSEFAAMLVETRPSWEEVAAGLTAMGVRDGANKAPSAERVRKTWWSVRRATSNNLPVISAQETLAPNATAQAISASQTTEPLIARQNENNAESPETSHVRERLQVVAARPRGGTLSVNPAPATAPDDMGRPRPSHNAQADMERLRAKMRAQSPSMPSVVSSD